MKENTVRNWVLGEVDTLSLSNCSFNTLHSGFIMCSPGLTDQFETWEWCSRFHWILVEYLRFIFIQIKIRDPLGCQSLRGRCRGKRIPAVQSTCQFPAAFLFVSQMRLFLEFRAGKEDSSQKQLPHAYMKVLARPGLCLKEKATSKKVSSSSFPKCKKVQARRRGAECWRERGYRREWDRRACVEVGSKNSKHPRPTHSWQTYRWWVCYPVIRKWLRPVTKPKSFKTPTWNILTKARNPTEDIMLQKVRAQPKKRQNQARTKLVSSLTPLGLWPNSIIFVTWIITH